MIGTSNYFLFRNGRILSGNFPIAMSSDANEKTRLTCFVFSLNLA